MSGILLTEQASALPTPSANKSIIYPKTDGYWYYRDDAGTEHKIAKFSDITVAANVTLGTEQATTSGTSKDFTGIPSGTKRITVNFAGVSTNGISIYLLQIGDSGGIENTGYTGGGIYLGGAGTLNTTGIALMGANPTDATYNDGRIVLELENSSSFRWIITGHLMRSDGALALCAGAKALSAELTQLRITTVNGTDTFDAGAINITYEG